MSNQYGGLVNVINRIKNNIIKTKILETLDNTVKMDKDERQILSELIDVIRLHKILYIILKLQGKEIPEVQQLMMTNPRYIMDIIHSIDIKKLLIIIKNRGDYIIPKIIRKYIKLQKLNILFPTKSFNNIINLLQQLSVSNNPIVNFQLLSEIKNLINLPQMYNNLKSKGIKELKKIARDQEIKYSSKITKIGILKLLNDKL